MSGKTKIEWCDATWNPVTGCRHGCEYCYARKIAKRFSYDRETLDAPLGLQDAWIRRGSAHGLHALEEPVRLKGSGKVCPYPFGFAPTFHEYKLGEPRKWKKPRNIFVCSMADLFGEWVPDEWIDAVLRACDAAPWHRYFFLTKNPKRYIGNVPLSENKWYGTTVTGVEDAHRFNQLPAAANRFVSAEPLMGDFAETHDVMFTQIGWIIIGAETGNRKGKMMPKREWVEKITGKADENGIPVFMKDSLIPVVGEENMRREFPWEGKS